MARFNLKVTRWDGLRLEIKGEMDSSLMFAWTMLQMSAGSVTMPGDSLERREFIAAKDAYLAACAKLEASTQEASSIAPTAKAKAEG